MEVDCDVISRTVVKTIVNYVVVNFLKFLTLVVSEIIEKKYSRTLKVAVAPVVLTLFVADRK